MCRRRSGLEGPGGLAPWAGGLGRPSAPPRKQRGLGGRRPSNCQESEDLTLVKYLKKVIKKWKAAKCQVWRLSFFVGRRLFGALVNLFGDSRHLKVGARGPLEASFGPIGSLDSILVDLKLILEMSWAPYSFKIVPKSCERRDFRLIVCKKLHFPTEILQEFNFRQLSMWCEKRMQKVRVTSCLTFLLVVFEMRTWTCC